MTRKKIAHISNDDLKPYGLANFDNIKLFVVVGQFYHCVYDGLLTGYCKFLSDIRTFTIIIHANDYEM